jgi:xanthine dehydrogenase small subunit
MTMARSELRFYLNGEPVHVAGDEAFLTLSEFLRQRLGLTGTKIVCSEGDCGACSVVLGRPAGSTIHYESINSCIHFLHQLDATHVVTVEGLSRNGALHPVQQAMVACHGSQCGFCTPGFVTTMASLFEQDEGRRTHRLSEEELRDALSGNLCRCTGYVQIVEAACSVDPVATPRLADLYPDKAMAARLAEWSRDEVRVEGRDVEGRELLVYLPRTWEAAAAFKAESPDTLVVAGATDLGVQRNKGRIAPRRILGLAKIDGDDEVRVEEGILTIGARATWTAVERAIRTILPDYHRILLRFGGPQIRSAGTVGGNLVNASPIADSLPFHFVTETELELVGTGGTRRVPIAEFYLGYRKTALRPDELLRRIVARLPRENELLRLYKVSKRKNLDISTFTAAILVRLEQGRIAQARVALGGVGPVVLRLPRTEDFLRGRDPDEETMREAGRLARGEITPITDVRGRAEYRARLAENIFMKFYHDVAARNAPAVV